MVKIRLRMVLGSSFNTCGGTNDKNVEFKKVNNIFQRQLLNDIKKIKER